ncbi:MAG TPA: mannose-1-phosphate guanylyltransferase [Fimbriimonadaceae bacterium]|nr:mannose-1-phosphate guanylyltransferase [Fimbriimonadaceae bacterium]
MGNRRVAVVMAGGSGTRFWPVSTAQRPKQFLRLASPAQSLLAQSVGRIAPLVGDDVFVSTSEALRDPTLEALPGWEPSHVLCEPCRRNTFGALVWTAANLSVQIGGDASMAVLTADHMISPDDRFLSTVEHALEIAERESALVTIGVKPTRAATEYGYIETGSPAKFVEKPDAKTAQEFLKSGRHLWNSGMFFWTMASFKSQLARHCPDASAVLEEVVAHLQSKKHDAAALAFERLPNISIDYALMERSDKVAVVEAEFDWDDLGSWDALSRALPRDNDGNVSMGEARIVDCSDNVVYNDKSGVRVNVLGMKNVVVVVSGDEVLVCDKSHAQDVRDLAD